MSAEAVREPKELVVTALEPVSKGKGHLRILRSEVWDGAHPLGLGIPLHSVLERTAKGVRIRRVDMPLNEVSTDSAKEIAFSELSNEKLIEVPSTHKLLLLNIHPSSLSQPNADWQPKPILLPLPGELDRSKTYLEALLGVGGLCLLATVILFLWHPAPPPADEVIPARLAKLLLSPALKQKVEEHKQNTAQNKTPAYNVVQAFKSEEVKKTTSRLLDAGVAKSLLAKSALLDATGQKTAVRKLFSDTGSLKQLANTGLGSLDAKLGQSSLVAKGSSASYGSSGTGPKVVGQGSGLQNIPSQSIEMEEGLTKDEVGKVIRSHISEIRYCYESAMVRNSHLEGKLMVAFRIDLNGTVGESVAKETSGEDSLDTCILDRLAKWKFPHPRGKNAVHVTYPFIFKVLGG